MAQIDIETGTEQRLLESALKLFSMRGYEGTSVRKIIEDAGVTRPALYYYFESKEDLYRTLLREKFAKILNRFTRVIREVSSCRERLKSIILSTFEDAERAPEVARLMLNIVFSAQGGAPKIDGEELGRQRLRPLVLIMEDGIRDGELRNEDPVSLALAFSGLMDMHVMAKLCQPDAKLTRKLGEGLVELFLEGASSKGIFDGEIRSPFIV